MEAEGRLSTFAHIAGTASAQALYCTEGSPATYLGFHEYESSSLEGW